jgi:hypothetical protein
LRKALSEEKLLQAAGGGRIDNFDSKSKAYEGPIQKSIVEKEF